MLEIIPFRSGRRPLDEAVAPGHGCSEHAGYICSDAPDGVADDALILFRLHPAIAEQPGRLTVRLSAVLLDDAGPAAAVPALTDREVAPQRLAIDGDGAAQLVPADYRGGERAFVAAVPLQQAFAGSNHFDFAHGFFRRLRVVLTLCRDGQPLHPSATEIEVYDLSRLGSLYARLRERLLPADIARQSGRVALSPQHHPWFPVLAIGMEKAQLYLAALRQDLAAQRRHLPDARWLLRVGLYLELLTCLGICEAVKDEHPDLLSPEERRQLAESPSLQSVRRGLRVRQWRRVWALHQVVTRGSGLLAAGPVSLLNLLRKQKATLGFLHAHHEDLRRAILLAGPNLRDAQETWLRVFRDAERAVWRQSELAFPELQALPAWLRHHLLWRQAGELGSGQRLLPRPLAALLGDRDGIFPAAARQYRRSMNQVARWARRHGLMDWSGDECLPESASLIVACRRGDTGRLEQLQRRDGYASLDLGAGLPAEAGLPPQLHTEAMLRALEGSTVLRLLPPAALSALAEQARPLACGPLDRVVLQGDSETSLYVVISGQLEVLRRDRTGGDAAVGRLAAGQLFGEYALLTGARRTATVRALDEGLLCEIRRADLLPLLALQPEVMSALSRLMVARQQTLAAHA